jgi:hypothetical protein
MTDQDTPSAEEQDYARQFAAAMAEIQASRQLRARVKYGTLAAGAAIAAGCYLTDMPNQPETYVLGSIGAATFGVACGLSETFSRMAVKTVKVATVGAAVGYLGYLGYQGVRDYLSGNMQDQSPVSTSLNAKVKSALSHG